MKRFNIINTLIKKYGYKTYLEIGTQNGFCFQEIQAVYKESVDPEKIFEGVTHEMTSDEYFQQNTKRFDIIFVDGLHTEEQTSIDIVNSLKCLNEGGTIVAHDCLPHCEEFIKPCWNGTVFRSIIDLRCNRSDLSILVVDTDNGCGIIQRSKLPQPIYNLVPVDVAKTFSFYENNKQELMNIITPEEFIERFAG